MFKKIFGKLFKSVDERAEEDDEYFKRTANKYYKSDDTPHFGEDYFKGTGEEDMRKSQEKAEPQAEQRQSRRTTTTDSGVTIIDDRDEESTKRKIFAHDEGEYVDYEVAQ